MNESSKRNWSSDEIMEQGNDPNKRSRLGPTAEEEDKDKDAEDKSSMSLKPLKPVVVEEGDELDDQNRNLNASSRGHLIRTSAAGPKQGRWRSHVMAEDYISLVGDMMYPPLQPMCPFGYDPCTGRYPLESITTLSLLTSPLRRPTVIEKWSPYEIAVFEASLALVGKKFHQVQKWVKTKNCKEIIEFYYIWKKTGHYKVWKRQFVDPEQEAAEESDDDK